MSTALNIIMWIVYALILSWLAPKAAKLFYWGKAREQIREKDRLQREKNIREREEIRRKRRERRAKRMERRESKRLERERSTGVAGKFGKWLNKLF